MLDKAMTLDNLDESHEIRDKLYLSFNGLIQRLINAIDAQIEDVRMKVKNENKKTGLRPHILGIKGDTAIGEIRNV